MNIGIDFGITNTDIAIEAKGEYTFHSIPSRESIDINLLEDIFIALNIDQSRLSLIAVTGGKSSDLPHSFKSIPIKKVNEVLAIGYGAKEIYNIQNEPFLVVSAGTGTACVSCMNGDFNHLGGISVGGGTLQGLSNLIIKNNNAKEINDLAILGNKNNLDALIGDVVNDIGSLYPEITASNFLKARKASNQSNEDLAASLSNMVGEVIGTVSYLNALLIGTQKVYFLGRVSLLESVMGGINRRLDLAKVEGEHKDNREYGNAIGALAYLKANT